MAFKTPGVYVQEISLFPPSVAEVATAIPAFIGYTEKAEKKGEDLTNKPTRISSLLEYRELFGGPHEIESIDVEVDENNNYAVTEVEIDTRFYLYDSLRLFFDNGGGKCYIVSVGDYDDTIQNGDEAAAAANPGLRVGLKAVEKVDEPTMLLFPDATLLTTESHFSTLQQQALAQCAKLQDRVGVFDLFEGDASRELDDSVEGFRKGIGINNLKYGAAYTPWLNTSYAREVGFDLFRDNVTDAGGGALILAELTSDSDTNDLVKAVNTALADQKAVADTVEDLESTSPSIKDRYKGLKADINSGNNDATNTANLQPLLDFFREAASTLAEWKNGDAVSPSVSPLQGENLKEDLETYAESTLKPALTALVALEKNDDVLAVSDMAVPGDVDTEYAAVNTAGWLDPSTVGGSSKTYAGSPAAAAPYTLDILREILDDLDDLFSDSGSGTLTGFISQIEEAAATHVAMAQTTLYQGHSIISNIVEHIKRELGRVPPSGAIAGVYAFVDNARGVWKAPANVSLSAVSGPVIPIDDADQEDLNVDVNAGKSINAVRAFSGLGTLVWGARTLAGNDNEWRYVAVRRFYNMVEESVKKSTSWAVFEPNAAPLWTKVKSMIDNYLIQKWRDGALAGATPDDAFFVKVGLGQTMTAQDILEGRLNVEIGMAVVRPAEFIILKFSHKLQES